MCACSSTSVLSDSETICTVAHQVPHSTGCYREWVAMPSSRGSSQLRDQTSVCCISCISGIFFTTEKPGKCENTYCSSGGRECQQRKQLEIETTWKQPKSGLTEGVQCFRYYVIFKNKELSFVLIDLKRYPCYIIRWVKQDTMYIKNCKTHIYICVYNLFHPSDVLLSLLSQIVFSFQ